MQAAGAEGEERRACGKRGHSVWHEVDVAQKKDMPVRSVNEGVELHACKAAATLRLANLTRRIAGEVKRVKSTDPVAWKRTAADAWSVVCQQDSDGLFRDCMHVREKGKWHSFFLSLTLAADRAHSQADKITRQAVRAKRNATLAKMTDPKTGTGGVFRALRGGSNPGVSHLVNGEGSIVTEPKALDAAVRVAWEGVYEGNCDTVQGAC
eukprot:2614865-Alexandrium_andersonii.AAC.1